MNPSTVAAVSTILSRKSCPCAGRFTPDVPPKHYVWVCFLHYKNGEYRQEQCGRDFTFVPVNRMACWLSGTDIYHCQMMFWNQARNTFETFSIDSVREGVHVYDRKEFKDGWTFYRLEVEKWQEIAMYQFLKAQLGKPLNKAGMDALFLTNLFPSMAISGEGESWFCAELCVATLQRGNLFIGETPATMLPGVLRNLIETTHEAKFSRCTHPVVFKRERQKIGLL